MRPRLRLKRYPCDARKANCKTSRNMSRTSARMPLVAIVQSCRRCSGSKHFGGRTYACECPRSLVIVDAGLPRPAWYRRDSHTAKSNGLKEPYGEAMLRSSVEGRSHVVHQKLDRPSPGSN